MKEFRVRSILLFGLEVAAIIAVAFTLLPFVAQQIDIAQRVGNAPSGTADAPSEFDALNSAMHYYKEGFLKNAGLPDRGGPLNEPYDDPTDVPALKLIYTHYPPGPNWLVGVSMIVFGPKQVPLYRSFPIAFSISGLILVYALLRSSVGCILASAALVTIIKVPMTTRMMHSLFFHPYALTMILVQMAFLLNRLHSSSRLSNRSLSIIAGMSFLQGWLSFDWVFVAILCPLALVNSWINPDMRREMYRAVKWSIFGFGLAHLLHFCQVWFVMPSFMHAFNDLFQAAVYRSEGIGTKSAPISSVKIILDKYLLTFIPSEKQAWFYAWGVPLVALSIVAMGAIFAKVRNFPMYHTEVVVPSLKALLASFVVSLMWIVIMRNHALEPGHWSFLPRHFIVVLFASILVAVHALQKLSKIFVPNR